MRAASASTVDPETQVVATIGAKEGIAHLMWVLLEAGDVAVVPTPSYPIHLVAPRLAGATVIGTHIDAIEEAVRATTPAPRVVVISYPHNPTTATATPELLQRLVDLARERDLILVHDFAYADIAFDGHDPPSLLQAEGAEECAVELYSLTKSFSMAGWRVGFVVGRPDVVQALAKLKSYLDYGTFQPIQIASIVALRECADYPRRGVRGLPQPPGRARLGLARAGWVVEPPRGTMFVWAPIPSRSVPRARWTSRCGSRRRRTSPSARRRLRRGRRRSRALRARRERATNRAGDALDQEDARRRGDAVALTLPLRWSDQKGVPEGQVKAAEPSASRQGLPSFVVASVAGS